MDAVTVFSAIAAISAVALVVSTLVGGSRAGSTHTPGVSSGTVPGDPMEQERNPGDQEPNRVRMVQMAALAVLVVSLAVLVILLVF